MELLLRNMNDTQRSEYVCTIQQRIAELGALDLCSETMTPKNRMREIRSYGSVGVAAGNRRHYPEIRRILAFRGA